MLGGHLRERNVNCTCGILFIPPGSFFGLIMILLFVLDLGFTYNQKSIVKSKAKISILRAGLYVQWLHTHTIYLYGIFVQTSEYLTLIENEMSGYLICPSDLLRFAFMDVVILVIKRKVTLLLPNSLYVFLSLLDYL